MKVIMRYTWDPDEYNRNSSVQHEFARELVNKLKLLGEERVLDIGSGDGKVTAEIAASIPKGSVVGIDSSSDMVKFAKKAFPADGYPNLRFRLMNARTLEFENEFDVVFSSSTLHWVKDHIPVLGGIKRSLKRSGRILIQMGGRGNCTELIEIADNIARSNRWDRYMAGFSNPWFFYGPEEYEPWVIQAGLKPKRVELISKDGIYKDEAAFRGWLQTTWLPYLERIPEILRNSFADEIIQKYLITNPTDESGRIHLKMSRLEVEATLQH